MNLFKKITLPSLLLQLSGILATFFGIAQGVDWLFKIFEFKDTVAGIAVTVAAAVYTLLTLAWLCAVRSQVMTDRIEECAKAKKELEERILKRRKSSAPATRK